MAYEFKRQWRRCAWCGVLLEVSAGDGIPIDPDDPDTDWVCDRECKEFLLEDAELQNEQMLPM